MVCDLGHYQNAPSRRKTSRVAQRGAGTMDDQQSGIPTWLSFDLALIAGGLILVIIGAYLGYADLQPLNLFAKGLE